MILEPSKQYINWFYEENKKGTLIITPKYQRNPIWSIAQKCFLVDSILSDVPIPPIYLNVISKKTHGRRKTIYEVVDGQQRLRAILEFLNDGFSLTQHTAKLYKVSPLYAKLVGKAFTKLAEEQQEKIWNFPLAVQELRSYTDSEIRDTFRRLNSVVERLNKQELRHSQFFGEFAKLVNELTDNSFWLDSKFFSQGDIRRMKDAEFVSELIVLMMDGIQDGQKTLDTYYAKFDDSFPGKNKVKSKFLSTLADIMKFLPVIKETRFRKKADFYAFFAAVIEISLNAIHVEKTSLQLKQLSKALDKDPKTFTGDVLRYYNTVIEGPNKLAKRAERKQILLGLFV